MKFRALFVTLVLATPLWAQEDSIRVVQPDPTTDLSDTLVIQSYAQRFNPERASFLAAVLPGMGQIYNKKYWKLPLVYGGFGAIGYGLDFYQDLYKDYKRQLFYILETGESRSKEGYTEDQLRPAIEQARHERDFMIILM